MTSPDLSGLIERVEAAKGPSLILDRDIALATYQDAKPVAQSDARISVWDGNGRTQLTVKPYTTSLDAAITLVPRGWIVEIRRYFNSDGEYVAAVTLTDSFTVGRGCEPDEKVSVSAQIVEQRQGIDPTPQAVVAASLRAQKEQANG